MGIHDREYYRASARGSGLLSGVAPACKAIILINVAAFVAQKLFAPTFDEWFEVTSDQVFRQFQAWRLLTATFLHDENPFHIVGNMLFLWLVGREIESMYGSRDFVAFYVAAAIVSTLAWAVVDRFGPLAGQVPMVGASGAVMAVVVLYTLYYPRRELLVMGLFPVEMWFLLVFYLGIDLLGFLAGPNQPVAYAAHLGGAAFGYLYKAGDLRLSELEKWARRRRRPRLRVVAPDPREAPPKPATVRPTVGTPRPASGSGIAPAPATRPAPVFVIPEEEIDEKLDAILVKIARDGRASLNDEDNRILDEASRRARNRRSERI
jgi:membrane associated rhomboid family serine protease